MKILTALKTAAIIAAVSTTSIANAEIFRFNTSFDGTPVLLTIDTDRGTASYVGGRTNVTYRGADFRNFNSPDTNTVFRFTGVSGVIDNNGRLIRPTSDRRRGRAVLRFLNNGGESALWTAGRDSFGRFRNLDFDGSITPFTGSSSSSSSSSSTSTGGLGSTGGVSSSTGGSTGGIGSSGGGTDVPAPGAIALLGLGMAGLAFGRRRRKNK